MTHTAAQAHDYSLRIERTIEINAPASEVWKALLDEQGPGMTDETGKSLNMKLEAWPGGRMYRDLGHNMGHFWALVQVIKPPPHSKPLLELCGPLFMSFAAINHVQYRLTPHEGGGRSTTTITLIHRAFGDIPADHREGMTEGWGEMMEGIKKAAERA